MSSSGKGQAGLELARSLWGGFRVHGVTATREYDVPARTAAIANETAATLGLDVRVRPEDVVNFDDFVGPGYGRPSAEGKAAVQLFARTEGLVLDPVYTGQVRGGPDRACPRRVASRGKTRRSSSTPGARPRSSPGAICGPRGMTPSTDGPDHPGGGLHEPSGRSRASVSHRGVPAHAGLPAARPRPVDGGRGPSPTGRAAP